jgi:hypothetical protein
LLVAGKKQIPPYVPNAVFKEAGANAPPFYAMIGLD